MRIGRFLFYGFALAVVLTIAGALAAMPHLINIQGKLTDSGGNPLPTGTYNVKFSIYDLPAGGTELWSTDIFVPVEVADGLFSYLLGSTTPVHEFLADYDSLYLGITVEGESEMTPRTRLVSTAYALRAGCADTAQFAYATPGTATCRWKVIDTVLMTNSFWGIARGSSGNALYGHREDMVNLGVACTTGTNGQDFFSISVLGGYGNRAGGSLANVVGGLNNRAMGTASTIAGGAQNFAEREYSTVSGGNHNYAGAQGTTVGGGEYNFAGAQFSVVPGGYANQAFNWYSAVGGGSADTAEGKYCGVAAGYSNYAGGEYDSASFVGGGYNNAASNDFATVGGGSSNTASGQQSTVGGGATNAASGQGSTIGGGTMNQASGANTTVCGGVSNDNAGDNSVILGGTNNRLNSAADYSMVFGYMVTLSIANRVAFFNGLNSGRLGINRDDGDMGGIAYPIHVGTTAVNGYGAYLSGGGTWTNGSSRTFKENFRPLVGKDVLAKIAAMPVESWNYKSSTERHIGPVAEDFVGSFDVGTIREDGTRDDKYLSSGDVAGVALLGVKELAKENQELRQAVEELKREIAQLKSH